MIRIKGIEETLVAVVASHLRQYRSISPKSLMFKRVSLFFVDEFGVSTHRRSPFCILRVLFISLGQMRVILGFSGVFWVFLGVFRLKSSK